MDPGFDYIDVGGGSVAYQLLSGSRDRTIVYMQTGTIPFESIAADSAGRQILDGLSAMGHVVLFDRRGVGLSDPLPGETWAQECWAQDLIAVIEATAVGPVVLFAQQFMDFVLLALAQRRDLVESVIWYEPTTDWIQPKGPHEVRDLLEASIAGRADFLTAVCPSRAEDHTFRHWFEASGARGASPATAKQLYRRADAHQSARLRQAAMDFPCPLLILRRPDSLPTLDRSPPDNAIFGGAKVREVPGEDWHLHGRHLESIVNAAARFIDEDATAVLSPRRILGAVMFTDIVDSTTMASAVGDTRWKDLISTHDTIVQSAVIDVGGDLIKCTGDGAVALFPSATSAIDAYNRIHSALSTYHLRVRAGIHVGDVDLREGDISGLTVTAAARIMDLAEADQLLVSLPVVIAMLGSRATFHPRGEVVFKGLPDSWPIFELEAHGTITTS